MDQSKTRRSVAVAVVGVEEMQLLHLGEYVLDVAAHRFLAPGGRAINCTPLECRLLVHLMGARGRPISTERLMARLYGEVEDEPAYDIIKVTISKLRRKLKIAGIADPIRCESGIGYSIISSGGIEVFLFDRARLTALDAVLAHAALELPDAVALLRRAAA